MTSSRTSGPVWKEYIDSSHQKDRGIKVIKMENGTKVQVLVEDGGEEEDGVEDMMKDVVVGVVTTMVAGAEVDLEDHLEEVMKTLGMAVSRGMAVIMI